MTFKFVARGICVDSLSNAISLYSTLGFQQNGNARQITPQALPGSAENEGLSGTIQPLRNAQGAELMLVHFNHPRPAGNRERRPNNQYGLTHLAFWVEDIEQSAERWEAAGGTAHWHTRALFKAAQVSMMYICDSVGTRIELMQRPEGDAGLSHSGLCTHNPERSQRFYEALGFTAGDLFDLQDHSDWLDVINELQDVRLSAQMVTDRKGMTLELLDIQHPVCIGELQRPALANYGFNFLMFCCEDLEAAAQQIEMHGGVVQQRAYAADDLCGLSCSDPDGVRVELVAMLP